MHCKENDFVISPASKRILLAFAYPKTPKQAQVELSVKKIKLKPFLEKHFLKCLNPECRKGRFYIITERTRKILEPNCPEFNLRKDWPIIGWIMASPRQRLVALRSVDERKLYSEEVRMRATQFNWHISRPSMKNILKELVGKHLVDTEILERIRFYWIAPYGQKIKDELAVLAPLSPAISSVSIS